MMYFTLVYYTHCTVWYPIAGWPISWSGSERSSGWSTYCINNQPTHHLNNQMSQPTIQPTNQLTNQSTSCTNQPTTNHPINHPISVFWSLGNVQGGDPLFLTGLLPVTYVIYYTLIYWTLLYCNCTIQSRIADLTTELGLTIALYGTFFLGPVSREQVLLYFTVLLYCTLLWCTSYYYTRLTVLYYIPLPDDRLAGPATVLYSLEYDVLSCKVGNVLYCSVQLRVYYGAWD